jgi:YVTN family beta-propeller protein
MNACRRFPEALRHLCAGWWSVAIVLLSIVLISACSEREATAMEEGAGTLVVLNKTDYTAMIIDMESREILATLPTGVAPHEADISPDGTLAVASNYGEYDGEPGHTLTVIDLRDNRVDRVIDLGDYTRPHGLAWLADGEHLLVTAEGKQALIVLHLPSGEVVQEIVTGQERSHIVALSADQTRAFVANIDYGTLSVIDLQGGEVVTTIETGAGAEGIAINSDESELWITNRYEDTIAIVDLESYEVVEKLQAGAFPIRANFTPDGRHLLVANMQSGDVSVFDVDQRTERMRIDLEPDSDLNAGPVGMLVIPGNRILVAGTQTNRLYVIDLETFEIIDQIPTGAEPDGMAYTG